ncbi:MAG TPA: hypothetical protein VF942_09745, partial [Acidimicrobiales bacterium]
PADVPRTDLTTGHRPAAAGRPPEHAQLVWRRAVDLADPPTPLDRFALALDLLRAARHVPATMDHALNLGRTHLSAYPEDAFARGGVTILETSISFLGVKGRVGDIEGTRP